MLIAMAGLPGAGKSTIAEILAHRLGFPLISVDPIESAILSAGIDSDQPTGLAAYLVADAIADAALTNGVSIIVDAVNAVNPAREQWVELAKKHRETLRFLEVICSDTQVHKERLELRDRNLAHIPDPTWHAVEQSLDEYSDWTGDAATVPRLTLDSVRPLGEVVEAALKFLEA
jgi:predicted kinase